VHSKGEGFLSGPSPENRDVAGVDGSASRFAEGTLDVRPREFEGKEVEVSWLDANEARVDFGPGLYEVEILVTGRVNCEGRRPGFLRSKRVGGLISFGERG